MGEFRPERDDVVAKWIERTRDSYGEGSGAFITLNYLLMDYHLHASTGVPLNQYVSSTNPKRD